jgi:hypothetical protein
MSLAGKQPAFGRYKEFAEMAINGYVFVNDGPAYVASGSYVGYLQVPVIRDDEPG